MHRIQIPEINYKGKKFPYRAPLGIHLDGQITRRVHDAIIPKYVEIVPEELAKLDEKGIDTLRRDAERQLKSIAAEDTPETRQTLINTLDLTTRLLQQ